MRTTADSAAAYLAAQRARAATVTDPRVLDLRAEIADLLADNRELRRRLDAMRAERDAAQRANRRRSSWGAGVALWDTLRGRTR
jgi:cell division protein FtsB